MLEKSADAISPETEIMKVCKKEAFHRLKEISFRCPLLELPAELRLKILELVLPCTIYHSGTNSIVWLRGSCGILATNRLLLREGIRLMYGSNTFLIDDNYSGITFAYQWLLPNGLAPKRTLTFPGKFARHNISHIRRVFVRIHHVDNYAGSVKYNFGGPGLREGLKDQVERLCQTTLQELYEIGRLHVHFQNDSHTTTVDYEILKPLLKLTKTRTVTLSGHITLGFAGMLQKRLGNAYSRNSIFRLPVEVRDIIYDLVLPYTETFIENHPTQHKYVRWRKGHTDILETCRKIHDEAWSLLYRTRNFQLTCGNDHFKFTPFWLPKGRLLPGLKFPEITGYCNFLQIRHFTIHIPVWWGHTDEKGRRERKAMLERMGRLLQTSPRIRSLTLVCFRWKLDKEWYEEAMQEILYVRNVARVEIFGLEEDMAERFRTSLCRRGL